MHITNDDEAFRARQLYSSTRKGVFVLEKAYSRSYDLKLGTEALVLILVTDKKIKYNNAIQMVGRGCRSQGRGKGILFLQGDPHAGRDAWDYLKATEKTHKDPGGVNLRYLFQNSEEFTTKELRKIRPIYTGSEWMCTPACLLGDFETEIGIILKVDKRRIEKVNK